MNIQILGRPWNPVTGCTKISRGCRGCYAERIAKQSQKDGIAKYANGFDLTLHPDVLAVPKRIRFIYFEPLMGPVTNLNLDAIHWAVVGGESGPGWRPLDVQWVRDIRGACVAANMKFFFKQYAGLHPESLGRTLDGREWSEMP